MQFCFVYSVSGSTDPLIVCPDMISTCWLDRRRQEGVRASRWEERKSQVLKQNLLSTSKGWLSALAEPHFDGDEVRINEIRGHDVVSH